MSLPIYRPIIWLTISMIIGILGGEACPGYGPWVLMLAVLLVVVLVVWLKRKAMAMFLPLLFFSSIGYLSIQPWVAPRFPDHHIRHFVDSKTCKISGTVLDEPVYKRNRTRFVMETISIVQDGNPAPACGRLRVTVSNGPISLSKGDSVSFFGRIRAIRNFNNPGGFNYERYMAFQNIWARSYVVAKKLSIQPRGKTSSRMAFFDERRTRISEMIDGIGTVATENARNVKAVLKALLIGDRKEISTVLREKFNRTGVGHLLAISGLHIGIVASVTFAIFRWMVAWLSPVLWAGWTRRTAAILTFVPVLAYGFLAGMSPSTQRAVIMVSIFLLTLLFDRDQDLLNTICIAGMLILVIHPPSLFSISFQLSFTAVIVIVLGMSLMRPILEKAKGIKATLTTKGVAFIAVTLFATVGTAPLVMAYFNQVSLIGVVVNIVAIPLVGFLAVPLGLLSVFIQLFSTGAASAFLQLSYWVLEKAILIIDFFSGLPVAALKTITPSLVEISLFYLMLLGVFNWFSTRYQEKYSNLSVGLRRGIVYGVLLFATFGWVLDAGYWIHQRFWHKDLRIMIFDVGQGSAALIELPGGRNLLIDGGGFADNAVFDTGKNVIAPYLLRNKIKTIHTLFLSHPNSDHLNGLIYIAKHFNVVKAITNSESSRTMGYQLFVEAIKKHGIDAPEYRALERTTTVAGTKIEILYPAEDFLEKTLKEKWRNKNNNSLVIKISYGRHTFLFPGDIMAMGEKALVAAVGKNLKSTVLVSPHHGSGSSSTQLLIGQVKPEIVVVSCGWMNRFKFPDKSVLQRYESMEAKVLRTDINGAIQIRTDGLELSIQTTIANH
ncbi:MAG: DNA internalization-related competence protein ComEC/Rec2 [Desulfobacterales bacterium]|nr:DNA internalization-related competence protein ComEC/Rec2 [Desulfobacterales bacterium]MDX2510448.1 DNA internalization-related competence protein ComEC/Rec2 [Desulfobacterales bacterium]